MFAFSCYKFSLCFANVTLAAISTGNVINGITNIFFVRLVFRFRKRLVYCLIGFKYHFDAVVFQNSVYWLSSPANVWNFAVPPHRFCNGGLSLLVPKIKHVGYPLDCNVDITCCFSLKCHYDQILDTHFFTFSNTKGVSLISWRISSYHEHQNSCFLDLYFRQFTAAINFPCSKS